MKKEERRERLSLTLLIALLVFAIQLFSILVAIAIIMILMRTGIIKELSEELLSPRNTLFLMSVISLLAGALVAAFSGKYYLRPVNRLINQMNRLASGDFKVRMQFGKPIASHPTFREIETSFNKLAQELESTEMLRSDFKVGAQHFRAFQLLCQFVEAGFNLPKSRMGSDGFAKLHSDLKIAGCKTVHLIDQPIDRPQIVFAGKSCHKGTCQQTDHRHQK